MVIQWFCLLNNNYNFANSHNWAQGLFEHENEIRFRAKIFGFAVKLWARCNEDRTADIMMEIISGNFPARKKLLIGPSFAWLLQPEDLTSAYIITLFQYRHIDNVSTNHYICGILARTKNTC